MKCVMCDNDVVFAVSTPVGIRSFCTERCWCLYTGAEYKGEGYYGYTKENGSLNRVGFNEERSE